MVHTHNSVSNILRNYLNTRTNNLIDFIRGVRVGRGGKPRELNNLSDFVIQNLHIDLEKNLERLFRHSIIQAYSIRERISESFKIDIFSLFSNKNFLDSLISHLQTEIELSIEIFGFKNSKIAVDHLLK